MPHLAQHHYGKSRIRLVKVTRHPETHDVLEWTVGVYLTGDFDACFMEGDNTGIMATDTMKNTVYWVARNSSATTMEAFASELGGFLAGRNPAAASIHITVEEKMWVRITASTPEGKIKHPSAFLQRGPEVTSTSVTLTPGAAPAIRSGVKGLVILKTSHSAFRGFARDELTTLPETSDRLLGTEASIEWLYAAPANDFRASRNLIMDTLFTTFAQHDSLSVQHTLYAMAEAVLAAAPLVAELTLTMPNRHNLPVDFSRFAPPFAQENPNTIFIPTDEPHGLIHARITR